MAALPGIKANATSVAEKIGVAGQRYRETDEMLAEKARQHLFDHDDAHKHGAADPQSRSRGGGIGKYKASPVFGKDLPRDPDDNGPGSLTMPDKTEWYLAAPAATGQAFADKIAKLTRGALAEGGKASPTLEKIFGEIKNPFTFMAEEVPTLGSRIGGPIGAVLTVPAVLWDHQHGIPTGRAIVRGGAAFVAGTVVTGLVSGALGPELGIPAGIVAGSNASKFVDAHWAGIQEAGEAAIEFGKSAADGGFKAARLGR